MKLDRMIISMLAMLVGAICGCTTTDEPEPTATPPTERTNATYAVVVGMEHSRFAGECPGAALDAHRMFDLVGGYTNNRKLLLDNDATKTSVTTALTEAIEKAGEGGLVIFCYSGHGGSDPFPNTGIEETDGKDEYLCLWDTYMRDNEVWNIISKSKGRVFLICDCCHSATMYRLPCFKVKPPLSWDHTLNEKQPFSMLCWSGCPDDTYSYGSSTGGQFTNALLRHFKDSKTYRQLWDEIKSDRTLRAYENPQSTVLGDGFEGKEIFR